MGNQVSLESGGKIRGSGRGALARWEHGKEGGRLWAFGITQHMTHAVNRDCVLHEVAT